MNKQKKINYIKGGNGNTISSKINSTFTIVIRKNKNDKNTLQKEMYITIDGNKLKAIY